MVSGQNKVLKILVENAKTFKERNAIHSLTESEKDAVSNTMVTELFKSALTRSHVDFDKIPDSKGDITKYSGYTTMIESIALIRGIAEKNSIKIPEIAIVEKAISNIVANRTVYEKGFGLDKSFIILQYNTMVAACVEAVSILISSFVDYTRQIDRTEFVIINKSSSQGFTCIKNLAEYNKCVANGSFSKAMNSIIKSDREELLGQAVLITGVALAGLVVLVNLLREMVAYYYNARVSISDYLNMQAMFLELNKSNLEANAAGLPAGQKLKIIKKQAQQVKTLKTWADKINVNQKLTTDKTKNDLRKENGKYSFESIKSETAKNSSNQTFELL